MWQRFAQVVDYESDNEAAVDGDDLSMDVGGIWPREEADGGGDFFAFAVAMERNQREDFVLREIFCHVCVDNTWCDGIYANAFLSDLTCEGFDGADESGFGGGVVDLSRLADLAGGGGDDDDAAAAAG